MRAFLLMALTAIALLLTGCSSYNDVNNGWQGPTSPAESGQHGAYASQSAPYGPGNKADVEHQIKPIEPPLASGAVDATMEGSGNIAAQGDYKKAAK